MEPKDSEYYLGNRDCLPTILTLKMHGRIVTYELPWDAGADEIIEALYGAMIGQTFSPEGAVRAMYEFSKEHIKEDYE